MSSLSSALDTAKSSLAAAQTQTSIISRNIANMNTAGATRKSAEIITGGYGTVRIASVSQASNSVLYRNLLDASAAVGKNSVVSNGLDRINETIGDTALSRSPAAMVSKLDDALGSLAASPNNYELARNAATAAADLVTSLNEASLTVQTIRRDADNELVLAARDMNALLAKIEDLNNRIVSGTRGGTDITDLSDQRNQAVLSLSAYVGVSAQTRGDNDLVLYTDSGVTLFETTARKVEFSATNGLNETVAQGSTFRIDGQAVTGGNAYMPIKNGSVAGLVALRDDILRTYQSQLDEIARGLVATFSETDPSGTSPDQAGLFTSIAAPTPPTLTQSIATSNIEAGDRLTFDVTYGNETYKASYVFTSNAPSASDYRAAIQAAIDTAVSPSGTGLLGSGKVTVAGTGASLSITALGAAAYSPFGISNLSASPNDTTRAGGVATAASATGTPATVSIGTYNATGISAGDTLVFDFAVDGQTFRATHVFEAQPASAGAFAVILQSAVNSAVSLGDGKILGTGKVTAAIAGAAMTLATQPSTASHTLAVASVSGIAADSAEPARVGGLVAKTALPNVAGLANTLRLGAAVAADPTKIRDGVVFNFNVNGTGGFTARLNAISSALGESRGFSADSSADPQATLADYAASSVSWLQATRQASLAETEYRTTLLDRTQETLSNETGINMDEELTRLIEIERSYQASSKLISTIDEMLQTLLAAI